jgi:hypothetical protein
MTSFARRRRAHAIALESADYDRTRGLIYDPVPVVVATNLVTTMTPPRVVVVTTLLRLLTVACHRVKEVPERTLTGNRPSRYDVFSCPAESARIDRVACRGRQSVS